MYYISNEGFLGLFPLGRRISLGVGFPREICRGKDFVVHSFCSLSACFWFVTKAVKVGIQVSYVLCHIFRRSVSYNIQPIRPPHLMVHDTTICHGVPRMPE